MDFLTVKFKSKTVQPQRTEHIQICFHPMEIKKYEIQVPFLINSKLYGIFIEGQGVPLNLELIDVREKFLDLGSTTIKKAISKTVKVINNSAAVVDVLFDIWDRLPYYADPQTKALADEFIIEKEPVKLKKPQK